MKSARQLSVPFLAEFDRKICCPQSASIAKLNVQIVGAEGGTLYLIPWRQAHNFPTRAVSLKTRSAHTPG